jgi:hypothetical protein
MGEKGNWIGGLTWREKTDFTVGEKWIIEGEGRPRRNGERTEAATIVGHMRVYDTV